MKYVVLNYDKLIEHGFENNIQKNIYIKQVKDYFLVVNIDNSNELFLSTNYKFRVYNLYDIMQEIDNLLKDCVITVSNWLEK